jgi:hypothetical protein
LLNKNKQQTRKKRVNESLAASISHAKLETEMEEEVPQIKRSAFLRA